VTADSLVDSVDDGKDDNKGVLNDCLSVVTVLSPTYCYFCFVYATNFGLRLGVFPKLGLDGAFCGSVKGSRSDELFMGNPSQNLPYAITCHPTQVNALRINPSYDSERNIKIDSHFQSYWEKVKRALFINHSVEVDVLKTRRRNLWKWA